MQPLASTAATPPEDCNALTLSGWSRPANLCSALGLPYGMVCSEP